MDLWNQTVVSGMLNAGTSRTETKGGINVDTYPLTQDPKALPLGMLHDMYVLVSLTTGLFNTCMCVCMYMSLYNRPYMAEISLTNDYTGIEGHLYVEQCYCLTSSTVP